MSFGWYSNGPIRRHWKRHFPTYFCTVAGCKHGTLAFARKYDLDRHVNSAHGGQRLFCPHPGCKFAEGSWTLGFGRKDNLNVHLKRRHADISAIDDALRPAANVPSLAISAGVESRDPAEPASDDPGSGVSVEEENIRLQREVHELRKDMDLLREYHEVERRALLAALITERKKVEGVLQADVGDFANMNL
jgi:hypothetical protein